MDGWVGGFHLCQSWPDEHQTWTFHAPWCLIFLRQTKTPCPLLLTWTMFCNLCEKNPFFALSSNISCDQSVCVLQLQRCDFPLFMRRKKFDDASRTQPVFVNMDVRLEVTEEQVGLFVCMWSFMSMLRLITFTALRQGRRAACACLCVCVCYTCILACLRFDRDHFAPWKTYNLTPGEPFTVQSKYSSFFG